MIGKQRIGSQNKESFPDLQSVQVDCFSFFERSTEEGVLRCGADTIGDVDDDEYKADDSTGYDLVIQALCDADKHKSVAILLDFPSLDGDTPPGLSLSSDYWCMCSSQVDSLSFSGYTDTKWHEKLLQSTPSLKHLTFNSCGTLEVRKLTQAILPGLYSFELTDAFCSAPELTQFLKRHENSLAKVQMDNVSISDGVWSELQESILKLPKLKVSKLSGQGVHSD
jgi:hypothetical protein